MATVTATPSAMPSAVISVRSFSRAKARRMNWRKSARVAFIFVGSSARPAVVAFDQAVAHTNTAARVVSRFVRVRGEDDGDAGFAVQLCEQSHDLVAVFR